MKKKILGIIFTILALPSIAQIKLEENKTLPRGELRNEVQNISNVGKYYANVVAYSIICKFPENDNKIIFDSYFNKMSQFKASESEREYLIKDYEKEFRNVLEKNKDKNEKNSSCEKFKPEYEKIVEYVKK